MAGLTWHQCIKLWYPELLERAYFLPHVYMNRVMCETEQVSGLLVAVPQKPVKVAPPGSRSVLYDSDVRDDAAQQHVLYCLRELADDLKQALFVLSQINFGDYLGSPCYSAAAKLFPRPTDLTLKKQQLDRGDFDVIVISRYHGLLAGEIKSIGHKRGEWTSQQLEAELLMTLRKMWLTKSGKPKKLGQLGKAKQVLEHIVGDIKPSPPSVRATLILPNVTSSQLRSALEKDAVLKQALCAELGIPAGADPVDMCLCSDQMSDHSKPWDVSSSDLQNLKQWWGRRMADAGPDPSMNDQVYEEVVSRFAGPATVVQVHCPSAPRLQVSHMRTEGEHVSEAGERLTALALFPQQVQILHEALDMVFLAGPPGTGKTVMLELIALQWLRLGRRVIVFSPRFTAVAAAFYIVHKLQVTVRELIGPEAVGLVSIHFLEAEKSLWDIDDIERTACDLVSMADGNELNIIADEAFCDKEGLSKLCDRLESDPSISRLRMWAASLQSKDAPDCMQLFHLTEPLRCPPAIVREIQQSMGIACGNVPRYVDNGVPQPTQGPAVMTLHHLSSHFADDTYDCEECGVEVGRVLADLLDSVGKQSCAIRNTPVIGKRDVFILVCGVAREWRHGDSQGNVVKQECGLLRGLRKHVPVRVVGNKDQDALAEVAAHAGPDEVVFVNEKYVRGLERKIVVMLGCKASTHNVSSRGSEYGRLHAISRCTSQLIWVVCHNRGSLCDCENIGFSSLECQAKESNVQTD